MRHYDVTPCYRGHRKPGRPTAGRGVRRRAGTAAFAAGVGHWYGEHDSGSGDRHRKPL